MSIHTSSSIICSCAFPSLRCSQRSNLREKTEELRTSERPQRSAAALRLDLHFSTIMDLHYSAIIHTKAAYWTLDALTEAAREMGIRVSRSQVRRILLSEGVRWRNIRSWAQSSDPEFVPKGRK